MKKNLICILLLVLSRYLFSQEITGHYLTENEFNCQNNLIGVTLVKCKTFSLKVYKHTNNASDEKICTIYDNNNKIKDVIKVDIPDSWFFDRTCVTDDAVVFCTHSSFSQNYCYSIVYVDPALLKFKAVGHNDHFVADITITQQAVYYSTEMDNDTIRRISLADVKSKNIKGYYPNVTLYPDKSLRDVVHFEYQMTVYRIESGKVVKDANRKEFLSRDQKTFADYIIK